MRHSLIATAALYVLPFCSCDSRTEFEQYPISYDLAKNSFLAILQQEVPVIDFGISSGRRHMLQGWSDEETSGNMNFVWSNGQSSTVKFFLSQPRDLEVTFRCKPTTLPDSGLRVYFLLNERPIGHQALREGWRKYKVQFPAPTLMRGDNTLELLYTDVQSPSLDSSNKHPHPQLAVAWDYIRFDEIDPSPDALQEVVLDEGALVVRPNTRLDYFIELDQTSILTFDSLQVSENGSGELVVTIQPEDQEEQILSTYSTSTGFQATPVSPGRRSFARLSFHMVSPLPATKGDGIRLSGAVIRTRRIAKDGRKSYPRQGVAASGNRPNVIVYLIDTLRRDHLGCYGYSRQISPSIDLFAEEATIFRRAIAQSPWTKSSVASIFTGLTPRAHGVNDRPHILPQDAHTLAERLLSAGFRTACFSTNGWITGEFGFLQGFQDRFFVNMLPSDALSKRFFHWLDSIGGNGPFFAYVHSVDPHKPYQPSKKYRKEFASQVADSEMGTVDWMWKLHAGRIPVSRELVDDLISLYDAEIAFNDEQFGVFIQELKHRKIFDNSMIILLSDHGEAFNEHGMFEHGNSLYSELLDVPLLIKYPSAFEMSKGEVFFPVQHADVLPTILDCLGLEAPAGIEGQSLLNLSFNAGSRATTRRIFSYMDLDGRQAESVIDGHWKLIRWWRGGRKDFRQELYNMETDRTEHKNVLNEHPIVANYLLAQLKLQLSLGNVLPQYEHNLTDETHQRLKALGYIQ